MFPHSDQHVLSLSAAPRFARKSTTLIRDVNAAASTDFRQLIDRYACGVESRSGNSAGSRTSRSRCTLDLVTPVSRNAAGETDQDSHPRATSGDGVIASQRLPRPIQSRQGGTHDLRR